MFDTPSILARAPRTEAAQPLHVMFGTFKLTRVAAAPSAVADAAGVSVAGAASVTVDSVLTWQPNHVAANAVANNTRSTCLILVLLKLVNNVDTFQCRILTNLHSDRKHSNLRIWVRKTPQQRSNCKSSNIQGNLILHWKRLTRPPTGLPHKSLTKHVRLGVASNRRFRWGPPKSKRYTRVGRPLGVIFRSVAVASS